MNETLILSTLHSDQPVIIVDQTSIELSTFICAIFMTALCLFGFYSNIMSAIIFLHPIMRSPINILLGALSLIDFILICLVVLVFIIPAFNILIDSPKLRSLYSFTLICIYPLNMTAQTCSVWTFVLISLERFAAVCKPLKRHKLMTCSQARLVELIIVILSFFYNICRFWEFQFSITSPTGLRPLLRENRYYYIFYYTILYVLTHFFVPFFLILVLNACILRSLKKSYRQRQKMSRRQIQQRRTSAMIVIVTLLFAFCNTTPFLINIWEAIDSELFYGSKMVVAYILLDCSNLLIVLHSSTTAVIFWIYCKKYRRMFRHFASFTCFRDDAQQRLDRINSDRLGKALVRAHLSMAMPLLVYSKENDDDGQTLNG